MVGIEVVARGGDGGLEEERGGEREGLATINFAFCLKTYPTITKKNSPLTIAKCFGFKCHGSTLFPNTFMKSHILKFFVNFL